MLRRAYERYRDARRLVRDGVERALDVAWTLFWWWDR